LQYTLKCTDMNCPGKAACTDFREIMIAAKELTNDPRKITYDRFDNYCLMLTEDRNLYNELLQISENIKK
jgi:hypothetical protein